MAILHILAFLMPIFLPKTAKITDTSGIVASSPAKFTVLALIRYSFCARAIQIPTAPDLLEPV
jgi:hypothetical protein